MDRTIGRFQASVQKQTAMHDIEPGTRFCWPQRRPLRVRRIKTPAENNPLLREPMIGGLLSEWPWITSYPV
jgi:hypothetical protein